MKLFEQYIVYSGRKKPAYSFEGSKFHVCQVVFSPENDPNIYAFSQMEYLPSHSSLETIGTWSYRGCQGVGRPAMLPDFAQWPTFVTRATRNKH